MCPSPGPIAGRPCGGGAGARILEIRLLYVPPRAAAATVAVSTDPRAPSKVDPQSLPLDPKSGVTGLADPGGLG